MDYQGVVIEESLENKSILSKVRLLRTEVEKVTPSHRTPWLKQWTKHTIEVQERQVEAIAQHLARAIDDKHKGSWYADIKNDRFHYIIFRERVFKINRKSKEQ